MEWLKRLVSECITYELTEREGIDYIKSRHFPYEVTKKQFYYYKNKILSERYALDWMNQHTKIGFLKTHHRLIVDATRVYNDSLRRYFNEINKAKDMNRYTVMKLSEDYRENAKWLHTLSLASPVVAQIKAKIEANNKQQLREDVTKSEQDNQDIKIESRNSNGLSSITEYRKYDKFISRSGKENEPTESKPDGEQSQLQEPNEGLEKPENDTIDRTTEKRIRTRHNELIEGGAQATERVF